MGKSASQLKLACAIVLVLLALLEPVFAAKKKSRPSTTKARSSAEAIQPADSVFLPPGLKLPVPELPPGLTELPLAARGAIVIDAATGETLYEKNADEPQYPASTTKIMTA